VTLRVLDLFSGYTIREDGEIRSRFGRAVKPQMAKNGYIRIELAGRKYLLHRLLAQAFIPNPEGKPQVNHIDGDKANNAIVNLEWTTQSDNQRHAYQNGLQRGYKKPTPLSPTHKAALRGSRWKTKARYYEIGGTRYRTAAEVAERYGISEQTVHNRCKSQNWRGWDAHD
jgi:hypothetical protein